jgi:hypothetical protein
VSAIVAHLSKVQRGLPALGDHDGQPRLRTMYDLKGERPMEVEMEQTEMTDSQARVHAIIHLLQTLEHEELLAVHVEVCAMCE